MFYNITEISHGMLFLVCVLSKLVYVLSEHAIGVLSAFGERIYQW